MSPETTEAINKFIDKIYPFVSAKNKQGDEIVQRVGQNPHGSGKHIAKQKQIRHVIRLLLENHSEILALEGYNKTEWISLEDRLPECDVDVLCSFGRVTQIILRRELKNHQPNEWLWRQSLTDSGDEDYFFSKLDVKFWQPLPTPPKQ